MERGPLPLNVHAALEPFIGAVLIASPWIFGFSDVDEATVSCVALGVIVILTGMMTDWRVSLMRVIPIRTHMIADYTVALLLIVLPFVLGFSDNGAATRFMVIAGVLEAIAALSTRWDEREADEGRDTRRHGRSRAAH
ncbi:MAG TPA: SPW repeat protein [Solirubrobacterales bacterium]|nr:SPW repeat protein [Solirubrobacterales bacterium]